MKGFPGFTLGQLNAINRTSVRTNIPGYRKNENQNVLIPENAETNVKTIHAQRAAHKNQRSLEHRIERLEQDLSALKKIIDEGR